MRSARDVLTYIDNAHLAALICLAYSYSYASSLTGEAYALAELRSFR